MYRVLTYENVNEAVINGTEYPYEKFKANIMSWGVLLQDLYTMESTAVDRIKFCDLVSSGKVDGFVMYGRRGRKLRYGVPFPFPMGTPTVADEVPCIDFRYNFQPYSFRCPAYYNDFGEITVNGNAHSIVQRTEYLGGDLGVIPQSTGFCVCTRNGNKLNILIKDGCLVIGERMSNLPVGVSSVDLLQVSLDSNCILLYVVIDRVRCIRLSKSLDFIECV